MARRSELPLTRTSLFLVTGDKEELARFYPVPPSIVVRAIVHNHVKKLKEKESREGLHVQPSINLDELPDFGAGGEGSDDGEHGAS